VKGTPYKFGKMTACRCGGGWAVQVNVWQGHITARVHGAIDEEEELMHTASLCRRGNAGKAPYERLL